jgi:hypothetical protein
MPAVKPDLLETAIMANPADPRMMIDPMNSSRTASHLFALMEGKYAYIRLGFISHGLSLYV